MKCALCDNHFDSRPVEHYDGFDLYHCPNCDLQFWHPMQNPDAEWYSQEYVLRDRAGIDKLFWNTRRFLAHPPIDKGELLDVGCGIGMFLDQARFLGFEVTGLDFDKAALEMAKKRYGLSDLHAMDLLQFGKVFPDRRFDIITMFEVLEHLDNPGQTLQQARDMLRLGGWLVLSVPNRNKWFPGRDLADYPPHHFTRWSRESLWFALRYCGFANVVVEIGPVTWTSHTMPWLTYALRFHKPKRYLMKFLPPPLIMTKPLRTDILVSCFRFLRDLRDVFLCIPAYLLAVMLRIAGQQGSGLYAVGQRPGMNTDG